MSEQIPEGGNTSGTTPPADDGFKPITSQDELNRIIGERVKRAKPADYDDLKSKAARLDEIEEANKTEQQKLSERLEAAETVAREASAAALRFKIASKYGVSDEDVDLFLTASDEETLTKQAERLSTRADDRKKRGNHVPGEGSNPPVGGDERRAFADFLTGNG